MAFPCSNTRPLFLALLSLIFLSTLTHSASPPTNTTTPVPATTVCRGTQDPGYCSAVLQSDNRTATVYEYGRFSFKKSISQATKLLNLVNKYLSQAHKLGLTPSAVGALQDCSLLAQLNIDFFTTTFATVNSAAKSLPVMTAEDVQTLLSGVLTNSQTCLEGLKSTESTWSVRSGLVSPLTNDTKLYSVALCLFNKAWAPKKLKTNAKSTHHRSAFGDGRVPGFNLSDRARAVLESTGRRLLQSTGGDAQGVMISDLVTVSQDGSGNFTLISDAVAAAPNNTNGSDGYFLIYVKAGVYEEYVTIDKKKKYVMMIGDGINQTIITGNRNVVDNYTTFNSATLAVVGTGFVGINITVRNTAGAVKHQAVALRNGADLSTFYSCSFEGYQDTLYAHSLRQFYRECDIYGTVDFIFGNAAVVFQNCNLYPRLPMANQFNAITAQGRTDPNQNTGISIENCTIRAADDLANSSANIQTFLGRPWKQYSRTVYMQSFMSDVVDPAGWRDWNGTFGLDTLYYGEYNNTGPGSDTTRRVTWPGYHIMNVTEATNYTTSNFIFGDEWLPQTGVAYFTGLL